MRFIGDVHGKVDEYKKLAEQATSSFQVGDVGIGFPGIYYPELGNNHKFIRGNHDDPGKCEDYHNNYLGNYGYLPNLELFYLSGAWSIDYQYRVIGISWWEDEELSNAELSKACNLYYKVKPKIMVTHECPTTVAEQIKLRDICNTRTGQALWRMLDDHQPNLWVFGHHHQNWQKKLENTQFVCLDELSVYDVEGLEF